MVRGIRQAMHDNNLAAGERVASLAAASASARVGPWSVVDTGRPEFEVANGALVVGSAAVEDLALARDWYARRGVPFNFVLRDDADSRLIAALLRQGHAAASTEPTMLLRSPRPPAQAGPLTVAEIVDDDALVRYGTVNWPDETADIGIAIARTARDLGFTLLIGTLDGEPVACSMAVVTDGLIGVYNVAVREPFRRRGFGEAMTWAAVDAGLARGASSAWIHAATPIASRLYERMGFRTEHSYVRVPHGEL